MIRVLKYHWQLRKLHKEYDKTSMFYKHKSEEAKKEHKNREEIQNLEDERMNELQYIDEQLDSLVTRRLCKIANKLMVPVPDHENKDLWWEMCVYQPGKVFTTKGIQEIRRNIRTERKERWEVIMVWFALLTGLIGATTGLVAVVMR